MKWHKALAMAGAAAGAVAGVGPLAVTGVASAQAAATSAMPAAASTWSKPIEVPGLGALNTGHDASGNSISCASPGNCAATGNFVPKGFDEKAFVVNETKGRWGKAIEVPGLTALNKAGDLFESSVGCGLPGDCAVGGDYIGGRDNTFAFIASEVNGKWNKAISVPGLAALNTGKAEDLASVSCARGADNCTAGGDVSFGTGSSRGFEAYVINEKNGKWGKVTLLSGLNAGKFAKLTTLNCPSAGNCSAGGTFAVTGGQSGWVINEKNGKWGKGIEVPGLSTLNAGGQGEVDEMSCPSAGNCGAGGVYEDSEGDVHAFVVSEKNGTWGNAIEVPGTSALNTNGFIDLQAMSCTAPGDCAASGTYKDTEPAFQGWVASEKNGKWGQAIEIPGLAALNKGTNVGIARVACGSTGTCVAFGNYQPTPGGDDSPPFTAFVASETNGKWANATPVPGLKSLAFGDSSVHAVSCPSAGHCSAAGFYQDHSGVGQAFVVDQK